MAKSPKGAPSAHEQLAALRKQLQQLQEQANTELSAFMAAIKDAVTKADIEAPAACTITLTYAQPGGEFAIALRAAGADRAAPVRTPGERDPRLPPAGTKVTKVHRGQSHELEFLENGVRLDGVDFGTVSGAAKSLTGAPTNGFEFFGLNGA